MIKVCCPVCGCPLVEGVNKRAYMCPNEGGSCTVAGYLIPKLFWEMLEKKRKDSEETNLILERPIPIGMCIRACVLKRDYHDFLSSVGREWYVCDGRELPNDDFYFLSRVIKGKYGENKRKKTFKIPKEDDVFILVKSRLTCDQLETMKYLDGGECLR